MSPTGHGKQLKSARSTITDALSILASLVKEHGGADHHQAWASVVEQLERAQLDAEDRALREAVAFDAGLETARTGSQELVAGFDDLPFDDCPEAWGEKPFARICWHEDCGDPSVGIAGQRGWTLARDQAGTVLQDLVDASRTAPPGVVELVTRDGGPIFLGGQTCLPQPFARITQFRNHFGRHETGWTLAADQRGTTIEPLLAVANVETEPPPMPQDLLALTSTPAWVVRALHSALDRPAAQAAAEAAVLARVLAAQAARSTTIRRTES